MAINRIKFQFVEEIFMKKLIICMFIILLFSLTSCSANGKSNDIINELKTSEINNDENIQDVKNDSSKYIELSGANRTYQTIFINDRLILPKGELDYFSYSNYQYKTKNIPNSNFKEIVDGIEKSLFYDSVSQLVAVNPSFSGGSNLGTIIYFGISSDEYETKFTISADSNGKIFISIDTGNSEDYQTYCTTNNELLKRVKDISEWQQVNPDEINIQESATTYFEVDKVLNIEHDYKNEYEYYILDKAEVSVLLNQFSDEKKADGSEIMERDAVIKLFLEDGSICYCVVDLYTGLLALEQQLYEYDDDFKSIFTNIINTKM